MFPDKQSIVPAWIETGALAEPEIVSIQGSPPLWEGGQRPSVQAKAQDANFHLSPKSAFMWTQVNI